MLPQRKLYEILEDRFACKFCHIEGDGDDGAGDGDGGGGDGGGNDGGGRGNSLLNNNAGDGGDAGGDGGQGGDGDAKWYWSEGVPGEGEVPDWLQTDKYKTADEQAKAYNDANKKLGQRDELRGAPESYELSVSDEVKALIPEADLDEWGTAPDWFLDYAKENDFTNKQVNDLVNNFNLNELGAMPDPKEEATKLGATATERINRVANLINTATKGDEDLANLALKYTTTADGIRLFEAIMKAGGAPNINDGDGADDDGTGAMTKADLKELMFATNENGVRRMHSEPDYAKMVNAHYKKFMAAHGGRRKTVDISPPGG